MADTVLEQIAALRDEDWAVREDAALALAGLRDKRAVEPLILVLRDSDRAVREYAEKVWGLHPEAAARERTAAQTCRRKLIDERLRLARAVAAVAAPADG